MKYQANRNYISNDDINTPRILAKKLVKHFKPSGKILEPCKGKGNFYRAIMDYSYQKDPEFKLTEVLWCEIKDGRDFFDFREKVDWVITNPPWSKITNFLEHSLSVSNNVCFLCTINHLFTRKRLTLIFNNGFGIKEITIFDYPELNNSGFQLGAFHVKKGQFNKIKFTKLNIIK